MTEASHDPLTGLPNRALFLDHLAHALLRAERSKKGVAVLLLDLDNFKVVNDSLGHEAGYGLLAEVTERLRTCLRDGEAAAHLGRDEFALLLPNAGNAGEAETTAVRVIEEMRSPFVLAGHEVFALVSIGITLGLPEDDRPEDLLRRAEVALREAKRKGKGRHETFAPAMDERARERRRIEEALRRGIERGDEFTLLYQPRASTEKGEITGVEVLLGWEDPERGLVLPPEFVPVAEEAGLMASIDRWAIPEACREAVGWKALLPEDLPFSLAVDLSARRLGDPDLVGDVRRALSGSGLAPEALVLEITGSAPVEDTEAVNASLRGLKALGVKLGIGDFGAGYSSLSSVRRLPADFLNVHRSYVGRLDPNREDSKVIEAVISLAHATGLNAVVEGVETAEQFERLREMGCDQVQGPLISEPLESHEIPRLLPGGIEED